MLFQSTNLKKSTGLVLFPTELENAKEVEAWFGETLATFGQFDLCERVANLLRDVSFIDMPNSFNASRLEAVLALNVLSIKEHNSECSQYLTQTYMPYELACSLRENILDYVCAFHHAYSEFSAAITASNIGNNKNKIALVFARQMHYLCTFARLQMYNYEMPDENFWHTVNSLYAKAELLGIEAISVYLFGNHEQLTTVQDQFLILMMLGQLSEGNLTVSQIKIAHLLLCKLSAHIEVQKQYDFGASFIVDLQSSKSAMRMPEDSENLKVQDSIRYWNTADLVIELSEWSIDIDSGHIPEVLKNDFSLAPEAEFLRFLCREWASQPVPLTRSERVEEHNIPVLVVRCFPAIYQQVLLQMASSASAKEGSNSSSKLINEPVIYSGKGKIAYQKEAEYLSKSSLYHWTICDKSNTGMGIQANANDLKHLSLKTLFAFRKKDGESWSLGLVRRIRRYPNEKVFIGAEFISEQTLPISLRSESGDLPDADLPQEWCNNGGQIGLFSPIKKDGKILSGLFIPGCLYEQGRKFIMHARGQEFVIMISRLLERGGDWCLVETKRTEL